MGVDNPEFTNAISGIVFCLVSIYIAYCFIYGTKSKDVKPFQFPDRFEIGYIDDPPPQIVYKEVYVPRPKKRNKTSSPKQGEVLERPAPAPDPPKAKQEMEVEQAMVWLEQFKTQGNFLPADQLGQL